MPSVTRRELLHGLGAVLAAENCGRADPAAAGDPLPGSLPLTWEGDLAERMMDGAHAFVERKIAESVKTREQFWKRDLSSVAAYEKSVEGNRRRLREILGVVDQRLPVRMERFGDDGDSPLVAETELYRVYQVRWPVLEGVSGEGLLLEPVGRREGQIVALPDADQSPEQICGLAPGVAPEKQFARRLAENGFQVVVPTLVDRTSRWSGNPDIRMTDQPHREWIYRQAYHMGRHVIGYEVQKVLAAVDWFERTRAGQGGDRGSGLWRGRAVSLLRRRRGHPDRRRAGERLFQLAAGRLVRAHLPQRLGVIAGVRRRGGRHPDRAARPGGRVQQGPRNPEPARKPENTGVRGGPRRVPPHRPPLRARCFNPGNWWPARTESRWVQVRRRQ